MPTPLTGSIALGDTLNDSLGYFQTRRYSFSLDTAQTVRIFMDGLTLWDAYLTLRDTSGRQITFNDDGGGNRDALIQQQLAAGTYVIEATSYRGFYSGTYALSLSTLAPVAPATNTLSPTIATNTGAVSTIQSGGTTRDNTVTLSGTLAAGSSVAIYDGDLLLGTSAAGGANWQVQGSTWRFTTNALNDGLHTLRAEFRAGNTPLTSQSVSVTVDTMISGSMDAVALTDTGSAASVANGGTTTDHTLGLSGTAEAGSTVSIFDNSRLLGTATLTGTTWAFTTPDLSDGRHALTARITDAAGNTYVSNSLAVSLITGAAQVGNTVTGSLKLGQAQTYSLTLDSAQKLRIFLDGLTLADAFLTVRDANGQRIAWDDNSGGNRDALIERSFQPGQYTIEAGSPFNLYSGTYALSISNLDANALYTTIGTDTGRTPTILSGGTTRDTTALLSGTRAPGTTVAIYDGDTLLGTSDQGDAAWQFVNSKWSFTTPALTGEGVHALKARFTAAGASATEQTVSVTVDTVAEGNLSNSVSTSSGATLVSGANTTEHVVVLAGRAEAGSVVQILDGSTVLGTGWISGDNWTYSTPILSNGDHSLSARITDLAGNTASTASVALAVSGPVPTTPQFAVDFVYNGDPAYQIYLQQAATKWSSIITADVPDYLGVDDLQVTVSITNLDGPGGTLTQSSVTGVRPDSQLPYAGTVEIDSSDLARMVTAGILDEALTHEIGHLLGFNASTFGAKGLVDPNNAFRYTGANAVAEYQKLTGTQASAIPLEQTGNASIAGSTWSELIFQSELMTGYTTGAESVQPVSKVTVAAMADLGYSVNYAAADPYSLSWLGQYVAVLQA